MFIYQLYINKNIFLVIPQPSLGMSHSNYITNKVSFIYIKKILVRDFVAHVVRNGDIQGSECILRHIYFVLLVSSAAVQYILLVSNYPLRDVGCYPDDIARL